MDENTRSSHFQEDHFARKTMAFFQMEANSFKLSIENIENISVGVLVGRQCEHRMEPLTDHPAAYCKSNGRYLDCYLLGRRSIVVSSNLVRCRPNAAHPLPLLDVKSILEWPISDESFSCSASIHLIQMNAPLFVYWILSLLDTHSEFTVWRVIIQV